MTPVETLILVLYFFVLSILAIYGWHRYYLVYLYTKNKDRTPRPLPELTNLPRVTVQLPIFNEMYVADRLIDAVCEIVSSGVSVVPRIVFEPRNAKPGKLEIRSR